MLLIACLPESLQAMSAIDEKTKAERALKDLQKVQGEERVLFKVLYLFFNPHCQVAASQYLPLFGFIR